MPSDSASRSTAETGGSRFRRRRTNRRLVRLIDRAATWVITVGGTATIATILLVAVFLAWVVLPLFRPERLTRLPTTTWRFAEAPSRARPATPFSHAGIDEYNQLVWTLDERGRLRVFEAASGRLLVEHAPPDGEPTCLAVPSRDRQIALGFADGTIRFGQIAFTTEFLEPSSLPQELRRSAARRPVIYRSGILQRTSENQWRWSTVRLDWQPALRVKSAQAIRALDFSSTGNGRVFAALDSAHRLHVGKVTRKKNLLTGKVELRSRSGSIQVEPHNKTLAAFVALTGLGDNAILAWPDGWALRFDLQRIREPRLVEQIDLVPDSNRQLAAMTFLIGKTSLVTGDTHGELRVWFRIKPESANTPDGGKWITAHRFEATGRAVVSLAPSSRSRMLAAAYADGRIRLYHITSEQLLAETRFDHPERDGMQLAIAPKDDRLIAATDTRMASWRIDAPHPETTLSSVFRPVWYEGYPSPQHVWQSSSGSDDFEPKYGLMPLVFGTLKATVYSLLFAVPLALLAAIYTSEFMRPRARRVVKPTLEIMASLPSVVLGFLAALVFAPLVEKSIVALLVSLVTLPLSVLLGAYLWQLLPPRRLVPWERWRLPLVALAMALGLVAAHKIAPAAEELLFAGSFSLWLDGQVGSGTPAWMLLLLPLSALAVAWLSATWITPAMRRRLAASPPRIYALADLARFLLGAAVAVMLAAAAGWMLQRWAWDPRGVFVGTYVQRNALVVGATMGFAVIPIIFTIADDALTAVPQSLRAASLGSGATTWQTAVRVVVPTAMSGLFSAVMIGLGRAVGETMVVLMAAGNTPIMDWNVFNGFRTLSANIAVELPEAVVASTHYRMLFVAALLLFAVTFVVNTIAEAIRIRFRKRAFQL